MFWFSFNVFPPGFIQRPNSGVMEAGGTKECLVLSAVAMMRWVVSRCSVWPCPVGGITHKLEGVLFPSGPAHRLPVPIPPKFY